MSAERRDKLMRALKCLYIVAPEEVAKDVIDKFQAYEDSLKSERPVLPVPPSVMQDEFGAFREAYDRYVEQCVQAERESSLADFNFGWHAATKYWSARASSPTVGWVACSCAPEYSHNCPDCGGQGRVKVITTHCGQAAPSGYVAYSGKIAGISDKVDLTENSSLAVAGRTQGERVGRQSVPPDTAEPSLGSPVPPASLCWVCNKPIVDKAYGVGVRGAMHWECYDEIFPMAALRESAREAPSDITPHSSVIHTDLKVRCNVCQRDCMWHYLEDEDTIQFLFHDCGREASPEAPAAKEKA